MGWLVAVMALALLLPQTPQEVAARRAHRLYHACMDQHRIAALGNAPLQPELHRLAAITRARQLAVAVAGLHRYGIFVLFTYAPPPENRPPVVPGLLRRHMQRDFLLAGDSAAQTAREARAALSLTLALNPPRKATVRPLYLPLRRAALLRLAPAFDWSAYFAARSPLPIGAHPGDAARLRRLNRLLRTRPLAAWRSYLRWRWIHATAAWLSPPFVAEEFRYAKRLEHIYGGQPSRGALCRAVGYQFSPHDFRYAVIRPHDFFGDVLRLRAAQTTHELW